MHIRELQEIAHANAVEKGWWDGYPRDERGALVLTPDQLLAKLALVHSEVSEAAECVRDRDIEFRRRDDGKPEGLPVELADTVIRLLDLCGALGIDLEAALLAKHSYNLTRPRRHGGKAA